MTLQTTPHPFHRLLSYYSTLSPYPDKETIRIQDSIRGNIALGLDFPVALSIAIGRHLYLRNTGWFSLDIHVPSVSTKTTLLHGLEIDEKRSYSRAEITEAARPNGIAGMADAIGIWSLASDVKTGLLSGEDVVSFQKGTLFPTIEARRKGRDQVLPLYRGGPISVAGHSWVVKKMFDVDVYQTKKND